MGVNDKGSALLSLFSDVGHATVSLVSGLLYAFNIASLSSTLPCMIGPVFYMSSLSPLLYPSLSFISSIGLELLNKISASTGVNHVV